MFFPIVSLLVPLRSGMNKPRSGKILICKGCNKECYIPKYRIKTFKYCSKACKNKFGCTEQIEAFCEVCNSPFTHISSRCNKAKYCSAKCYQKSRIGRGLTEYKCLHCEKPFLDSLSRGRKYCSKSCVNKQSKSEWKAKFTTVRRNMITRGHIQKCEKCSYDKFPKILGVHHIDGNRENNSLENLMVLCPNCHSIEHMKHICH